METYLEFDKVDYKEAVRYIALNLSAQECRLSELRRVLPVRNKTGGTRPGMTGERDPWDLTVGIILTSGNSEMLP